MAVPQVGVVVRIALSYSQPEEYQCSSVGQIFQQYEMTFWLPETEAALAQVKEG
jgi:hypothetical protein